MTSMRTLMAVVFALGMTVQAAAPIPRPAPAMTFSEPGGKATTIASMKGKVVVVQFLLTTCPHCQAFSRALTKLTTEFGPKLQAVGLAFDKEDSKGVPNYVKTIGTNFPVGSVEQQVALGFMGISVMDYNRLRVPQVIVIDKKGQIRSQTELSGAGPAGDETTLRALLNTLVKE